MNNPGCTDVTANCVLVYAEHELLNLIAINDTVTCGVTYSYFD